MLHLFVAFCFHGLNNNRIAVDFNYDHDIVVPSSRLDWELPCLVSVEGPLHVSNLDVHIPLLNTQHLFEFVLVRLH